MRTKIVLAALTDARLAAAKFGEDVVLRVVFEPNVSAQVTLANLRSELMMLVSEAISPAYSELRGDAVGLLPLAISQASEAAEQAFTTFADALMAEEAEK